MTKLKEINKNPRKKQIKDIWRTLLVGFLKFGYFRGKTSRDKSKSSYQNEEGDLICWASTHLGHCKQFFKDGGISNRVKASLQNKCFCHAMSCMMCCVMLAMQYKSISTMND